MSKKQKGNSLKFSDMIISYDYKKDIFNITSKDKDLAGKPFKITLNNTSETEKTIRQLFVDKDIIKDKETPILPPLPNYQESNNYLNVPLGTSYDGDLTWNFKNTPHLLVNGHTGTGSTVIFRNIIEHAKKFSDKIDLRLFGNQIEYDKKTKSQYRIHSSFESMVSELTLINFEIERRYKILEEIEVNTIYDTKNSLKNIVVLINNYYDFIHSTRIESEKYHLIYLLTNILRLGNAVGINVFMKDSFSDNLTGEALCNFTGRIITGNTNLHNSQKYLNSDRAGRGRIERGYAYSNFDEYGIVQKTPVLFSMYYIPEIKF